MREISQNQSFVDQFNQLSRHIARMQSAYVTSQVEHQQRSEGKNWPFLLADYVAILWKKYLLFDQTKDRCFNFIYVEKHKYVVGNYAYFSVLLMKMFSDPPCFPCCRSHVQLCVKTASVWFTVTDCNQVSEWNCGRGFLFSFDCSCSLEQV